MQHLNGCPIAEVDHLARPCLGNYGTLVLDGMSPAQVVGRDVPCLPLNDVPNVVPSQDFEQAGNVVGVTVCQHHHVQRPVPERQPTPEQPRRVLRFGPPSTRT